MKQCTGCDRFEDEPLGVNQDGEPYLACCPDSNYQEVTCVVLWIIKQKDLSPETVLKALKIEADIKMNEFLRGYDEGLYDQKNK